MKLREGSLTALVLVYLIVRGQDPVELLVAGAPLGVPDVVADPGDAPVPLGRVAVAPHARNQRAVRR